jgi:hypothetical protein
MVKKLLIVVLVVLALGLGSFFIPAQQLNIEGVGRLSFESKITLSIGSETAYASPDLITNSPSANSGGWTDPTNAYADGGGYAYIASGTPSASHTYSGYGFDFTDEQINQVRVRYDAWCAGSADSQTRYPTGDAEVNGTWTLTPSGGSRYQKVDETPADDSDYIALTTTTGGYSYFSFSNFSVPSGATVNDVTVYYRHRDTAVNISYVGTVNSTGNNPTNGSFSLPSGWAAGDTAVFWWYTYANTKTFTAPAGVTQKQQASSSGYGRIYIGYRVLQTGDTTFAWTSGSVANSTTIWGTSVFRGVDPTGDPFEAESGAPATFRNVNDPNPPAVTTVSNNAWVIPIFGKNNDYTGITPPTNYTSAGSNSSTSGNDACAGVAYRQIATPGSEDPGAWTLSGGANSDDGYVWTGALRPNTIANTRAALKVGGTLYGTTDGGADPTASWADRSYAFTANPATGVAWTVAEVNGIQAFGINSTDSNPNIQISQCYAVVNYTAADEQIRVDVSWDGGFNWSAQQTTNLTGTEATYWYDVTGAPGIPWTPTMLNDTNFRVRVDAYTQGTASEVRLDWIPVEVDYSQAAPPTCWLNGWAKRVKLTIDRNDISAPLADFPVLVYLSTSSGRGHDDVSFVFDELQNDANRFKIAVTTSNCITQCYVEIEKWDQASEQAWLWVKVPSISTTSDTILHLYYDKNQPDNTTYVGDPTSVPGQTVWSNGFAGVWHLHDTTGGSGAIKDSTSNAHHGTDNGSPTLGAAGKIDNAINFDGTDDYIQTTSNESKTAENITWEIWLKADSTTASHHVLWEGPAAQNGWGEPGDANTHEMHLTIGHMGSTPDVLDFFYGYEYTSGDFGPAVEIQTAFTDTTGFHYAVAVLTGAGSSPSGTLYLDGSSVGTDTGTETDRSPWDTDLRIGRCGADQRYLDGIGDEVRISATSRNPAWIFASYESGRDDLIDYGPEEGANISNTPSSIDFGYVDETHSYWSNGAEPVFPLDDGECFFTLTNNSSAPANIAIRATNFSGGAGWTLAGTPGVNTVTLKAGRSGDNAEGDMVILTTGDQTFITNLPASSSRKWEIKLETGTFSDYAQKTSTITLTATIA